MEKLHTEVLWHEQFSAVLTLVLHIGRETVSIDDSWWFHWFEGSKISKFISIPIFSGSRYSSSLPDFSLPLEQLWHVVTSVKSPCFFMCFHVYFHDFPRFSMFYLSLSSPFQQAPKYTGLGACAPRVGSPTSSEIRQMNKNGNDQPILIPIKI